MFIALLNNDNDVVHGKGLTLQAAMDELKEYADNCGVEFENDEIEWFEAVKIEVKFKIEKVEKPVAVASVKRATPAKPVKSK